MNTSGARELNFLRERCQVWLVHDCLLNGGTAKGIVTFVHKFHWLRPLRSRFIDHVRQQPRVPSLGVSGSLSDLFVLFAVFTIGLVFSLKVLDFLQHTLNSAGAQCRIENVIVKSVRPLLQKLRKLDPVVLLDCWCFGAGY